MGISTMFSPTHFATYTVLKCKNSEFKLPHWLDRIIFKRIKPLQSNCYERFDF